MTDFCSRCYELLCTVPVGKVVTYGQLAMAAGSPRAARAVGTCMKKNPDAPHTPCHRVVGSDGSLTGYSGVGGIEQKRKMLQKEGVQFIGKKVDFLTSRFIFQ